MCKNQFTTEDSYYYVTVRKVNKFNKSESKAWNDIKLKTHITTSSKTPMKHKNPSIMKPSIMKPCIKKPSIKKPSIKKPINPIKSSRTSVFE